MGVDGQVEAALAAKLRVLLPHLDERQRRLLMGAEARSLGRGGIRLVARAAEGGEGTVSAGVVGLGRAGHARGSDVTAAVDDEVDPYARRRVDRVRASDIGTVGR